MATITRQRTGHLDDVEGGVRMDQQGGSSRMDQQGGSGRMDQQGDEGSTASGAVASSVAERADAVLRDCVQALVGLASRTPGFDIQVSDGGRRSVRLRHVGGGLAAQLLMDGAAGAEAEPIDLSPSPASFVAELTAVLAGSRDH
jgi:hypothetical protein